MEPPHIHARHLRILGQLLGEIHPAAPRLLAECAAQLDILAEISAHNPGLALEAVERLIAKGHQGIMRVGPKMQHIDEDHPFNPSRN